METIDKIFLLLIFMIAIFDIVLIILIRSLNDQFKHHSWLIKQNEIKVDNLEVKLINLKKGGSNANN